MDVLDFIKKAEGTADQPDPYSTVLGYGRYGSPPKPLTEMTLDAVYDFGRQILRHPENNFNSSATGAYQIVGRTMRDLQDQLGLSGDTLFSPAVQDRMAYALMKRRGLDPAGLRAEWQGLEKYDDDAILSAFDGTLQGDDISAMMRPIPRPDHKIRGLRDMASAPSALRQMQQPQMPQVPDRVFLPHEHQKLADFSRLQRAQRTN